ncbi:VAMP-like protein YKT62 [Capsicum annuum]|nr:VAMP-like protein YKT62 [Capsicum annuum]
MKITALMVLKSNDNSSNSEGSDPVILANACDVSHFGYFQRSSVKEFIVFVGRTVAKRNPPGQRQSVQHEAQFAVSFGELYRLMIMLQLLVLFLQHEEYKVHSYNRNGLCALGFMDDHYPVRSAFSLLNQVLDEYMKNFGDSWKSVQSDNAQPWPYLNEALAKFQDPAEADKLFKIQRELDETKIILIGKEEVWNRAELYVLLAKEASTQAYNFPFLRFTAVKITPLHKTIDSVLERGEKLDSLVEKSSDLSAASQSTLKALKRGSKRVERFALRNVRFNVVKVLAYLSLPMSLF